MKVDLSVAATSRLTAEQNVKPVSDASVESTRTTPTDRTTLHADQTVQSLVTRALQSPEVRQPLVDELRQSVSSGSYQASPAKTATSIISHES